MRILDETDLPVSRGKSVLPSQGLEALPDNPKAIVTKACRYEPDLNRTFEEMAERYGCAIIPERAGKPRGKDYCSHCASFIEQAAYLLDEGRIRYP